MIRAFVDVEVEAESLEEAERLIEQQPEAYADGDPEAYMFSSWENGLEADGEEEG